MSMNEKLVCLLYSLGLSAKYIGFHCVAIGVEIAGGDPMALTMVTKCLYPQIAERMGTNWKAVERNIRSAIDVVWKKNPVGLQQISNGRLKKKPTAAQFISILVSYVEYCED